ncbi:MAG: hypothetical protein ABIG69_18985 [Bacteroidota bacterium]
MTKIITLEQLINTSYEELITLYQQGYKLNEMTEVLIYPKIDDVLPHSRSGYNFASK